MRRMSVYKLPMMTSKGGGGSGGRGGVGLEKLGEDLVVMEVWVGMLVHPSAKDVLAMHRESATEKCPGTHEYSDGSSI